MVHLNRYSEALTLNPFHNFKYNLIKLLFNLTASTVKLLKYRGRLVYVDKKRVVWTQ